MRNVGLASLAAAALLLSVAAAQGDSAEARIAAPTVNDATILGEGQGNSIPRTLEEFGFFIHADAQIPTPGVVPYELNTPLYSDGAAKLRFAYVPAGSQAIANDEGLIAFPVGSALIKTFAFGEGDQRRLIETRVLLHREDGWLALPYKWNEEQTEARLAIVGGRLDIDTPDNGTISYLIPNKNQCKQCHSVEDTVVPIGPKARNLSSQWLSDFAAAGHLDRVPEGRDTMPVWSDRNEVSLDSAARDYLDVNCAHCHQPGGKASNSGLDLRWEQDDPTAIGVRKRPVAAGQGSGGLNFSIVPVDPSRSIMVHRMASENPGVAMPELGKTTIDVEGVETISQWIASMASEPAT